MRLLALDTTQVWGDGSTSSSDGQRFLFPRRVLRRTYSHRLGDFALEFYTFIANNYAPYYTVPIECTERDAPYVLDGLLYHESDLDPEEHYTDTHGYIELNFAAFPMFGKRFCPRIRGLHRQWIYRIDPHRDYGPLTPDRQPPEADPSSGLDHRPLGPHGPVFRLLRRRPHHRLGRPQAPAGLWATQSFLPRRP